MSIQLYLQNSDTLPGFAIVYRGLRDVPSGITPGDNTDVVTQKLLALIRSLPIDPSSIKSLFDGSAPLVYDETTGTFSIQKSSAIQNGYLSSGDYAAFSGKLGSVASAGTGQDIVKSVIAGAVTLNKIRGAGSVHLSSDANGLIVTGDPIPAQFAPVAGANMSITGTYPNLTFASSGGGGGSTDDSYFFTP